MINPSLLLNPALEEIKAAQIELKTAHQYLTAAIEEFETIKVQDWELSDENS